MQKIGKDREQSRRQTADRALRRAPHSCGEYIGKGRKFNARKETPENERYLGIQIYRFYIRCTRCSAEIIFRTDPKNQDYAVERGAKKNTEPWRRGLGEREEETDEQRLDRLEREMAEAEGEDAQERNAMMELEAKTEEARREMAVADALDEIRSRNARLERAQREGAGEEGIAAAAAAKARAEEEERARQEREDDEASKRAFAFARRQEYELMEEPIEEATDGKLVNVGVPSSESSLSSSLAQSLPTSTSRTAPPPTTDAMPPPPSFARQVKKKKDRAALLGIKKKSSAV